MRTHTAHSFSFTPPNSKNNMDSSSLVTGTFFAILFCQHVIKRVKNPKTNSCKWVSVQIVVCRFEAVCFNPRHIWSKNRLKIPYSPGINFSPVDAPSGRLKPVARWGSEHTGLCSPLWFPAPAQVLWLLYASHVAASSPTTTSEIALVKL